MGMYTELKYDLVLQKDTNLIELIEWLKEPHSESEHFTYKIYPPHFKDYKFFNNGRKGWFTSVQMIEAEDDLLHVKGTAELKNYESQIENLFEMFEPYIISGEYKSLYEEFDEWYDHMNSCYEEKEVEQDGLYFY